MARKKPTVKSGKFTIIDKRVTALAINEVSYCKHSGRYAGVSIGRDKNGYFAMTHRARSKSYPSPGKIPVTKIKFIRSTG